MGCILNLLEGKCNVRSLNSSQYLEFVNGVKVLTKPHRACVQYGHHVNA